MCIISIICTINDDPSPVEQVTCSGIVHAAKCLNPWIWQQNNKRTCRFQYFLDLFFRCPFYNIKVVHETVILTRIQSSIYLLAIPSLSMYSYVNLLSLNFCCKLLYFWKKSSEINQTKFVAYCDTFEECHTKLDQTVFLNCENALKCATS